MSRDIGGEKKRYFPKEEKKQHVLDPKPDRGHGGGLEGNSGLVGSWPSRAGFQPDPRDY